MTAYVIADVTVTNPEAYAAYRPLAAASIAQYGGKFIARGGAVEPLEGGWSPGRGDHRVPVDGRRQDLVRIARIPGGAQRYAWPTPRAA